MSHPDLRHLRAPQEDGAALVDPQLNDAAALVEQNRAILKSLRIGTGFSPDFRQQARASLLSLVGVKPANVAEPLVLSGHQPELFHPGVWFKNFVLSRAAQLVGGRGINLIIDNDTIRSAGIRVPTGGPRSPEMAFVPFDAPSNEVPWERRDVLDENVLANFRDAVRRTFAPFLSQAEYRNGLVLDRFWPHTVAISKWRAYPAIESPERHDRAHLATCLVGARHEVEKQLGLQTTECSMAGISWGLPFVQFAACIFERHREFHEIHNAALAQYRVVNKVRSKAHPVPELAKNDEWYEMPFWLWTNENPRRRPLFVRDVGNSWEITDRQDIRVRARKNDIPEMERFADRLVGANVSLRPRALITTMYARLVLSDLFIHGIGGAKYDELTDLIIERFFGIEPPAYVTATATFRLPIDWPQVTADDVRQVARRIREVRHRPESFLRDSLATQDSALAKQLADLAAEKREFLAKHDLRRCPQEVFDHLDRLNSAMHDLLRPVEAQLRAEHAQLVEQLKQSQLLGSREFSFVLFPAEILPARLLDLSKASS
jgi:hypothetical protein